MKASPHYQLQALSLSCNAPHDSRLVYASISADEDLPVPLNSTRTAISSMTPGTQCVCQLAVIRVARGYWKSYLWPCHGLMRCGMFRVRRVRVAELILLPYNLR